MSDVAGREDDRSDDDAAALEDEPATHGEPANEDEPATHGEPAPDEGSATGSEPPAATTSYPTFVPVEVVSVSFDLPSPSPTIHLREDVSPYRGIDFPIGLPEAQSIAMALEREASPRPSTHELLAACLAAAGCDVVAVRITGARGGTLLAELDLSGPKGRELLDCRPTDGIAIALRMPVPAPILADASLLI